MLHYYHIDGFLVGRLCRKNIHGKISGEVLGVCFILAEAEAVVPKKQKRSSCIT
jgi:hypothetical protein